MTGDSDGQPPPTPTAPLRSLTGDRNPSHNPHRRPATQCRSGGPDFGKAMHDGESGSLSGHRRCYRTPTHSPMPPSSPEPEVPAAFEPALPGAQIARHDRMYMHREHCKW